MSLWWPLGTHSYLRLPLTLAQKPQVLLNSRRHLSLLKKNKKLCTNSPSHTCFLSFCSPFAHSHSVQHQSHSSISKSDKEQTRFLESQKKGRGKRQHPPSNTVYDAEWSCVLGWQSIYTWKEGNWYWDRSNIAANEALPPGKLGKSWRTAEEIFMKAFPKKVKQKQTKRYNQMHTYIELYKARFTRGCGGLSRYSCMF